MLCLYRFAQALSFHAIQVQLCLWDYHSEDERALGTSQARSKLNLRHSMQLYIVALESAVIAPPENEMIEV